MIPSYESNNISTLLLEHFLATYRNSINDTLVREHLVEPQTIKVE